MKLHIRIPKLADFFFVVSRDDPERTEIVEVEKQSEPTKMDIDQMERNLDRINMWIGNCDQKASFLLAFVGVAATIFITSDVISKLKDMLVIPFLSYWRDGVGSFSTYRCIIAVSLFFGLGCILTALVYLLLCLMAKTDYSKFKQQGMESKSLLFYKHIASMSYSDFSLSKNDIYNDLRSQTYTNACICTDKFRYYKIGLICVLVSILFLALTFILILFT